MSKLDVKSATIRRGSLYPSPFDEKCAARIRHALGDAGGLSDFGVNLLELPPGAWSSQRHWHTAEDEFIYVISGEITLATNRGDEVLHPGDCATFPKGVKDGHHLINKSNAPVVCLEVGTRSTNDFTDYPDIDMVFDPKLGWYAHRDGKVYPKPSR